MASWGQAISLFIAVFILQSETCAGHNIVREKRSDDLGDTDAILAAQSQKITTLEAELQAAKNELSAELQAAKNSISAAQTTISDLQTQLHGVKAAQGSTFVRWGRSTCPSGASLVYSGVAGGAHHRQSGGGTNRVCLSVEPVFDNTPLDRYYSVIEGAQYYLSGHHQTDVLCVVCHTSHPTTIMVPGTNRCPAGYALQYRGYLTAGDNNDPQGSEYLCLDASPEDRMGSQDDVGSSSCYFEHVRTHCGSLPCPPYVDNKVLTCAVCSK